MLNNKIYLDKEFDKFWEKIESSENFTLLRYGDGERAIMCGEQVKAQEGWKSPDYVSALGKALLNTLNYDNDNIYYGISCPCCDNKAYYWYSSRIKNKNITFANLWVNSNYQRFYNNFIKLKRDAILIANYRAKNHKIGNLNILKHYEIDDDCISFWENNAPQMIEEIKKDFGDRNDLLYVVSAGPLSEPIIIELYKNNPNNCYIDFGSSIDKFIHDKQTRPYMDNSTPYAKQNCWMGNPLTTDFNVSVVLNLYKRPENLKLQLDALEKQTLKPKEIILYQDGTSDTVKIPDDVKNRFDFIEIGKENKGVWERFRFAQRYAKSKYVCVFDDDTIPGSRWLENCHTEMMKQEGLYGTIGIIMKEPDKYPTFGTYYRVGWDGNLDFTAEVDFVGHSWFFKKEWLKYLFEAPDEIQKYKLCGEDMAFSYELLKHNIKTFVPPHPKNNLELFGSVPDLAYKLGMSDCGISVNSSNLNIMTNAIQILLKDWKTLAMCNKSYVKNIEFKLNEELNSNCNNKKNKIFGIQKTDTHKVVTVFGIKFKFKKSKLKREDKGLITVIVPMYNSAGYIDECIKSIINASYGNLEIILIDDCSADNTYSIAQKYTSDPRVILLKQPKNRGQAICRNLGLDNAHGEFVFFVDSDDYICNNVFEDLIQIYEKTKADIIFSKTQVFASDNSLKQRANVVQKYLDYEDFDSCKLTLENFDKFLDNMPCIGPGKLFRTKFLTQNKIRYINKNVKYEDDGFYIKLLSNFPQVSSLNKITYYYRIRPNSTTTIYENKQKLKLHFMSVVMRDAFCYIKKIHKFNVSNMLIKIIQNSPLYSPYFLNGKSLFCGILKINQSLDSKRIKLFGISIYSEKMVNGNKVSKILGIKRNLNN